MSKSVDDDLQYCVLIDPPYSYTAPTGRSENDSTTSAPNSPTSSARVLRSSSRACKFPICSLHRPQIYLSSPALPPMSHSARVATSRLALLQRPKKTSKAKTPAKPRKKAPEIQEHPSQTSPKKVVDLGRFAPNPPAGLMTPTPSLESLNGSSNPYGEASANDDILRASPRPSKRRRLYSVSSRAGSPAVPNEIKDIKGQEESIQDEDLEIDFQMLRLDEVVSLPWVPISDSGKIVFVPPGVHQLIDSMHFLSCRVCTLHLLNLVVY